MDFLRPVSGTTTDIVESLRTWLEDPTSAPLVVETSGSTGAPKRVLLSRDAVLASVHASARRLGASGQWLLALPPPYVAGVQVICRSLVAGVTARMSSDSRVFGLTASRRCWSRPKRSAGPVAC